MTMMMMMMMVMMRMTLMTMMLTMLELSRLQTVLQALDPGDVYTHSLSQYAGEGSGIVELETGRVRRCVLEARERGVIFDLGHGQGSFSWEVAELCARASFYPDTLSTDLHSGNVDGLARDLPWVMSKFLHLGNLIN